MAGAEKLTCDVLVIGGGIVGLFAALEVAQSGASCVVLERSSIGDPRTASYGITRSIREDYLDTLYASLAGRARLLWDALEERSGERLLIPCGCLNIAHRDVTPDFDRTYAAAVLPVFDELEIAHEELDGAALRERFPQVNADYAVLDNNAAIAHLPSITRVVRTLCEQAGVRIVERAAAASARRIGQRWTVTTLQEVADAAQIIVSAGPGTNDVLSMFDGVPQLPLRLDRPSELAHFVPAEDAWDVFSDDLCPIIAYLDVGVYLHPIITGHTHAVKISLYQPEDFPAALKDRIGSIDDFVRACVPRLAGAERLPVTDTDSCSYDLPADDHFIIGPVTDDGSVTVGVGWRGTGYKFAPWTGANLAAFALGKTPDRDVERFSPARFAEAQDA